MHAILVEISAIHLRLRGSCRMMFRSSSLFCCLLDDESLAARNNRFLTKNQMKIKFLAYLGIVIILLAGFTSSVKSMERIKFSGLVASEPQEILLAPDLPICPSEISNGDTIECSIVSNETDTYTFSGNANDRIVVRLQITSGDLDPKLQIDVPSETCTDRTIFSLLELNCTLTSDGSHTISVSGSAGQNGEYNLFLQRSNQPTDQTAIAYGQTLSDNITIAPEMDVFAFTGSIGDRVIVRMQITSGSFDPNLRIYNPNGNQLCTSDTIFDLLELNCILTADGLHTIFAYGDSNQTGSYEICVRDSSTTCDYEVFLPVIIR